MSSKIIDLASDFVETSYDKVPYKSYPFRQSHPERLSTIAHLLGLVSPPIEKCRVLEIGCASGGNLLPIADRFPESEFVGIDLSSNQISVGQSLINAAQLKNVRLIAGDIRNLDSSIGNFDYIIAHGVYSWIPNDAQDALLRICGTRLTSNGVAYVSYNTYPGWRMRGMVRDMMGYHTRTPGKPEDQVRKARALLNFLAESVPTEDNPYGLLLNQELQQLHDKEDYYLLHEHLEDVNEPVYFSQFAERAASHNLQYLGEADFSVMAIENFAPSVSSMLKTIASDIVETEQYMDFVRNRMFRQTLLCRSEVKLERNYTPDRLRGLHVASNTRPQEPIRSLSDNSPVVFECGNSVTRTTDPLVKAALAHVGSCWPASVPFTELAAVARSLVSGRAAFVDPTGTSYEANRLGGALLRCYATGHVELSTRSNLFSVSLSDRPSTTALTRILAMQQPLVTNARHESVQLTDLDQRLLTKLDGTVQRQQLVDDLQALMLSGGLMVHQNGAVVTDPPTLRGIAEEAIHSSLLGFARRALLSA